MFYRILVFFAIVFALSSCQEDIQGVETFTLEESATISQEMGPFSADPVDEILADVEALSVMLNAASPKDVDSAIAWYEAKMESGEAIDAKTLLNKLNISDAWVDKVRGYSMAKLELLESETNGYSHLVADRYNAKHRFDKRDDGGNGPNCGISRYLHILKSAALCGLSIDDLFNGSVGGFFEGLIGDCVSLAHQLVDYYQECIRGGGKG